MGTRFIDSEQADSLTATTRGAACPRARYLQAFLRSGPRELVEARDLRRGVVEVDSTPVPFVVNDGTERQCYLLSSQVHYVHYMREELAKIRRNLPARVLAGTISGLGMISGPLGFNRSVSANNWLLTTSPTLALDARRLTRVTEFLTTRFPDHPIVFRGVDRRRERAAPFVDAGYQLLIHRPVFEWDPSTTDTATRSTRQRWRSDAALSDDPRFEIRSASGLRPGEETDVARLYRRLYLGKHSVYNTRYTAAFFRAASDSGLMTFTTVRHDDRMVAFCCQYVDGERLVAALCGYDQHVDRREFPLYRILVADVYRTARQLDCVLFLSTGAATFKRLRGAREWLEYEAVYDRHLPRRRRLPWWTFRKLLDASVGRLDTSQI